MKKSLGSRKIFFFLSSKNQKYNSVPCVPQQFSNVAFVLIICNLMHVVAMYHIKIDLVVEKVLLRASR